MQVFGLEGLDEAELLEIEEDDLSEKKEWRELGGQDCNVDQMSCWSRHNLQLLIELLEGAILEERHCTLPVLLYLGVLVHVSLVHASVGFLHPFFVCALHPF